MQSKSRTKAWNLLLILPYIAMLWVPSYNSKDPAWLGLHFSIGTSLPGFSSARPSLESSC